MHFHAGKTKLYEFHRVGTEKINGLPKRTNKICMNSPYGEYIFLSISRVEIEKSSKNVYAIPPWGMAKFLIGSGAWILIEPNKFMNMSATVVKMSVCILSTNFLALILF